MLVEIAGGADLFICEAYYYEKKVRYHLDYRTLVQHRHELGCRRLLLTHLNADMLDRLDDVADECAEDGKTIEI